MKKEKKIRYELKKKLHEGKDRKRERRNSRTRCKVRKST